MADSMHLTSEHAIGIVEWRPLFYDHAENVKHSLRSNRATELVKHYLCWLSIG